MVSGGLGWSEVGVSEFFVSRRSNRSTPLSSESRKVLCIKKFSSCPVINSVLGEFLISPLGNPVDTVTCR